MKITIVEMTGQRAANIWTSKGEEECIGYTGSISGCSSSAAGAAPSATRCTHPSPACVGLQQKHTSLTPAPSSSTCFSLHLPSVPLIFRSKIPTNANYNAIIRTGIYMKTNIHKVNVLKSTFGIMLICRFVAYKLYASSGNC